LLATSLVVRGAGLGSATIAVMAGAFQGVPHDEVPDASSMTRIAQQLGGSFGSAVLATILAQQLISHATSGVVGHASAYNTAFWWAVGFGLLALLIAFLLPKRPPIKAITTPLP
jgi:hypothetical protein